MGDISCDATDTFNADEATEADPKLSCRPARDTLDVNQNVYTQSPVETRLVIVNQLESILVQ